MAPMTRLTALLLLMISAVVRADDAVLPLAELRVAEHRIEVEVARTEAARKKGLMERRQLAENRGMLLVYPKAKRLALWMRNTPLPLSAAFLDENGVILNIARMAPERLDIHLSKEAAKYALEMNQGWFAERGIGPGERVEGLRAPRSPVGAAPRPR